MTPPAAFAACVLLACAAAAAQAQEPDPAAFRVEASPEAPPPWGLGWQTTLELRDSRQPQTWADAAALEQVLDLRHEWQPARGLRLALSARAETRVMPAGRTGTGGALREAYASAEPAAGWFVDAGRVNLRQGVAQGWNPSDWLRAGGLGAAWQNPAAARENRLGAVMLRLQRSAAWGSAELAWLPDLAAGADTGLADWGLNLERGNDRQALFVRVAPALGETLTLDLGALARAGEHPAWSANLTALLSPRWLALLELQWQTLAGLAAPDRSARAARPRPRLAAGANVTLDSGAVLGLEWHHAADALDRGDWAAWRSAASVSAEGRQALGALRAGRAARLDPLVRDAFYLRLQWNDPWHDGRHDLAGHLRWNPADNSRWLQLEAAWHARPDWSLRLVLAGSRGRPYSEFGARAVRGVAALTSDWRF
ncbi:hypothetical protein [Rubrivivax gelatinosus]|uniref:hypothetical protein n=1 Tax=Rubrivivax gelatinosus TaxID=28068 RepID=UPI003A7F6881